MGEVYGGWQREAPGQAQGPFARPPNEGELRASGAYRVLRPDEVLALAERLGPDCILYVTPLLCGLAPGLAWESLRLLEREVLPHLPGRPRPA